MALNYSRRPIFSSHIAEDNFVNGYIVEGVHENNREAYVNQCFSSRGNEECFGFGWGKADWSWSPESRSEDIIDRLPSDPFGMDISNTVTAINGWLEDLEVDYGGFGSSSMCGGGIEDNTLFAGLHFLWNNAMWLHSFPGAVNSDETPIMGASASQDFEGRGVVDAFDHISEGSSIETSVCQTIGRTESLRCVSDGNDGTPHEALFFALGYLGVKDLLSVDRVCSSLHSAVHTDSLLWRSVHIDQPLNERISDDILFQLSSKAQGSLQFLCLVECHKITDDGLRRVVESNPQLTKLCVPGCTKLSVDGIISIIKDTNPKISAQAIKKLRIGGLYGATCTHYNQLKLLLGSDNQEQQTNHKPLFYNRLNFYLSCDDDRGLDIETCPMCQQPKLVYDCPAKECQVTSKHTQACRACILCIQRCVDCGRCTNENEFQENFYLDVQCSYCFKDPLKSQNNPDQNSHRSNGGRRHNLGHNR